MNDERRFSHCHWTGLNVLHLIIVPLLSYHFRSVNLLPSLPPRSPALPPPSLCLCVSVFLPASMYVCSEAGGGRWHEQSRDCRVRIMSIRLLDAMQRISHCAVPLMLSRRLLHLSVCMSVSLSRSAAASVAASPAISVSSWYVVNAL